MKKPNIARGQMFVCHSIPFPHSDTENETQVWVKVCDEGERSIFVNNQAMVKVSIKAQRNLHCTDKWSISDEYYNRQVAQGQFVPIDDLRDTEKVCKEKNWPPYEIDLGF